MNYYLRSCLLLLLCMSATVDAAPVDDASNYWQCTAHDASNKGWASKSIYQKVAFNVAYAGCKKESTIPASCKATKGNCEQFIQGISVQPMWRCTALDKMAFPWKSNYYSQRYDAALGAKAYCQQRSMVPETCYINLVTCTNINGLN